MRLKVLDERFAGQDVPDVVRAVSHRPEIYGEPLGKATQDTMRGPSPWSVAERELFAAFVSSENQCPF